MGDEGRHGGMDGVTMSRKRGVKGYCDIKTRGGKGVGGRGRKGLVRRKEEKKKRESHVGPFSPVHAIGRREGAGRRVLVKASKKQ